MWQKSVLPMDVKNSEVEKMRSAGGEELVFHIKEINVTTMNVVEINEDLFGS